MCCVWERWWTCEASLSALFFLFSSDVPLFDLSASLKWYFKSLNIMNIQDLWKRVVVICSFRVIMFNRVLVPSNTAGVSALQTDAMRTVLLDQSVKVRDQSELQRKAKPHYSSCQNANVLHMTHHILPLKILQMLHNIICELSLILIDSSDCCCRLRCWMLLFLRLFQQRNVRVPLKKQNKKPLKLKVTCVAAVRRLYFQSPLPPVCVRCTVHETETGFRFWTKKCVCTIIRQVEILVHSVVVLTQVWAFFPNNQGCVLFRRESRCCHTKWN